MQQSFVQQFSFFRRHHNNRRNFHNVCLPQSQLEVNTPRPIFSTGAIKRKGNIIACTMLDVRCTQNQKYADF